MLQISDNLNLKQRFNQNISKFITRTLFCSVIFLNCSFWIKQVHVTCANIGGKFKLLQQTLLLDQHHFLLRQGNFKINCCIITVLPEPLRQPTIFVSEKEVGNTSKLHWWILCLSVNFTSMKESACSTIDSKNSL